MSISKSSLVEDLRTIAAKLATGPSRTEEAAKAALAQHPCAAGHCPHWAGGLQYLCESTARDIEAIIRRLGGMP